MTSPLPTVRSIVVAVVHPVISHLLKDDELTEVSAQHARQSDERLTLEVVLRANGDELIFTAFDPLVDETESLTEIRERFASDVQDWIAESAFGWGEHRAWDATGL